MRTFLSILLHAFLFCVLAVSTVDAETIAVLDFKSLLADEDLGVAVAEILKTELAGLGEYTIIERGMLEQILDEQALQLSGAVDTDTAVKIGKLVGANVVVTGSVVKTGDMYTINSRFIDVETGIVKVGKNIRGQGENQISNMVQQLALIITGQAVITETPASEKTGNHESESGDSASSSTAEKVEGPEEAQQGTQNDEENAPPVPDENRRPARDNMGTLAGIQREFIEACQDRQEGETCQVKGPRGKTFKASCHRIDDQLACLLSHTDASKKQRRQWEKLDRNEDGFLDLHEFFGEMPPPGQSGPRGKRP